MNQIRWNPCSHTKNIRELFLPQHRPARTSPTPRSCLLTFLAPRRLQRHAVLIGGMRAAKTFQRAYFVYLPSALHFRQPTVFHFVGCVLADSATKSKAVAAAFGWKKVAWQGVASNNSVVPLFGKYFLWDVWSCVRTIREYALLVIRTRTGTCSVLNTSASPSLTSVGW